LPGGSPSLADYQWHELDLTRAGPHRFLVRVDGREIGRLYYPTVPVTDHEQVFKHCFIPTGVSGGRFVS